MNCDAGYSAFEMLFFIIALFDLCGLVLVGVLFVTLNLPDFFRWISSVFK